MRKVQLQLFYIWNTWPAIPGYSVNTYITNWEHLEIQKQCNTFYTPLGTMDGTLLSYCSEFNYQGSSLGSHPSSSLQQKKHCTESGEPSDGMCMNPASAIYCNK